MRALRIARFGDPDVLRIEDVADPLPQPTEVLVRVRAAGVNRADVLQRKGRYPPPRDAPQDIPGLEFAGEVHAFGGADIQALGGCDDRALGAGEAPLKKGQRVFGLCAGGAQAEYIAIDRRLLIATPAGLDDIRAAAIAEAYITAHDALITQAGLRQAERLLVHAVGSGVGIAALQIGLLLGCEVFGTSRSAWKLQRAAALGLQHPIAADTVDFAQEVLRCNAGGVNVVIDFVGAPYFERNLAVLASSGRLVSLATLGGSSAVLPLEMMMRKRLHLMGSVLRSRSLQEKVEASAAFARDVLPAIASGAIGVHIDKVFPLEKAAAAHRYLESNANFGKIVLTV